MNKLIPVISIIMSTVTAALAATGLVFVCVATAVPLLVITAIPLAIVSFSLSILGVGFGIMFKKDKLCRIALFVNLAALALSLTSIIIWLAVL